MIKRLFDVVISLLALLMLVPLLIVLCGLIWWKLGWPVIFRQTRPGVGGRPFRMMKFRTMLERSDSSGNQLPDKERMTDFGRALRSTSLDELPALVNVLNGAMSLVGPRPLLMEYLPLYSLEQARRHEVRPGITGWAQINGRNALTWEQKLALDVWYVDNRSFWLDIKILCMTVKKVLIREGITAQGEATMPKFTGTKGK